MQLILFFLHLTTWHIPFFFFLNGNKCQIPNSHKKIEKQMYLILNIVHIHLTLYLNIRLHKKKKKINNKHLIFYLNITTCHIPFFNDNKC